MTTLASRLTRAALQFERVFQSSKVADRRPQQEIGIRARPPERLAATYGKYYWCDGCGTRFEKYPGALFPPETYQDDEDKATD
jgi:hypothetical protein